MAIFCCGVFCIVSSCCISSEQRYFFRTKVFLQNKGIYLEQRYLPNCADINSLPLSVRRVFRTQPLDFSAIVFHISHRHHFSSSVDKPTHNESSHQQMLRNIKHLPLISHPFSHPHRYIQDSLEDLEINFCDAFYQCMAHRDRYQL